MNETIEFLKQYATASDNLYLLGKLELLETEIKIEILKAELETIKYLKK